MDEYVARLDQLRLDDADRAGGKGTNLGELVAAKLPVPPGFVLLRDCYRQPTCAATNSAPSPAAPCTSRTSAIR
ncbi:PEP/pyruvate-binding domain-containing protein [Nocardia terpenica]|nr:PEP/pyruvate-binding domain-containing protein [Nocardia terpenica]